MPFMFSIDSIWNDASHDAANIEWTRTFWDHMLPYSRGGRAYLNFAGLGEDADLVRRSYAQNYPRLVAIKGKYDPDNRFRFNQNTVPG